MIFCTTNYIALSFLLLKTIGLGEFLPSGRTVRKKYMDMSVEKIT